MRRSRRCPTRSPLCGCLTKTVFSHGRRRVSHVEALKPDVKKYLGLIGRVLLHVAIPLLNFEVNARLQEQEDHPLDRNGLSDVTRRAPSREPVKPDVTKHLGLVGRVKTALLRRNFDRTPVLADDDDLFSVGCIALMKAADDWNGRNSFTTYAWPCIWGAMVDELRKHGPIKRNGQSRPQTVSFSTEVGDQESATPITLAEIVPDPRASVEEQVAAREQLAALYAMPARPREALLRKGIGESLEEIAESWGVTPSRVCQIISAGRKAA